MHKYYCQLSFSLNLVLPCFNQRSDLLMSLHVYTCSESSYCYWQQKKSSRIIRHWVCPTSVSHGNGIWTMNYVLTQLPMSTWLIYHKLMRETIPICQQSYIMLSHIQTSHLPVSLKHLLVSHIQCHWTMLILEMVVRIEVQIIMLEGTGTL